MIRCVSARHLRVVWLIVALVFCVTADGGVRFDGKSGFVRIPKLRIHGTHPVTVEFIVTPEEPVDQFGRLISNLSTTDRKRNGITIGLWKGYWTAGVATERTIRQLISDQPAVYGARVHFAVVYESDEIRMYINGRPCETLIKLLQPMRISSEDFLIGAQRLSGSNTKYASPFTGVIEAVRISSEARYTRKFEPPSKLESDAKTLLLYDFDEKVTTQVADRSGYSFHGQISNASWVATDAKKVYDDVEDLQQIVGEYQVDRSLRGNATQFTSFYRLTSDQRVLEKDKQVGQWKVEKKNKLTIELTGDALGPVELSRKRDGSLLGEQKMDGRGMLWLMRRVRIAMVWRQSQYRNEKLLKQVQVVLYSNGHIGTIDNPATWILDRNTLIYDWANKNKAKIEISRDGQSYEGVNLDGHQVMGIRQD